MKKLNLSLIIVLVISLALISCHDDEDNIDPTPGPIPGDAILKILSIDPISDTYSFKNFDESTLNISAYQLCSEFRYTSNLSSLTVVSGSLNLEAGDFLTGEGPFNYLGEGEESGLDFWE